MVSITKKSISQDAIAREAGVARTTVSLALRGGDGLSPDTITKVMTAAEKLGYRPNKLVHGIRSGRTGLIGVMVPPYDTYWAEVLYGIHDGLTAADHCPLVLWSNHRDLQDTEPDELRQVNRLIDWRVDGAILWPQFANLYQEHIQELIKRDLGVVTIDSFLPEQFGADAILSDEIMGAEAVASHLLEQGHRHIIHFAGPRSESWARERRQAFEASLDPNSAVRLHSIELPKDHDSRPLIRGSLEAWPETTAIFAATDHIAEQVYDVARELGISIPKKLSVVGFGNVDFSSRLSPPLTTVKHRPYRMGRKAAAMLIERITTQSPIAPRTERLPVELILRGSSASPTP